MNSPIVYRLAFDLPTLNAFALFNIIVAAGCSLALVALLIRQPASLARFGFIFAGGTNLLFQWPLATFSTPIQQSLQNYTYFAICTHAPAVASIMWVAIVHRLMWAGSSGSKIGLRQLAAPAIALIGLLGIFFLYMPPQCTALFALMFDPSLTLLAREVTIKLAGSTIATSSFGAIAGAAAPATTGVALLLTVRFARKRRLALVVGMLALIALTLASISMAGSKGLLIPLAIVVTFTAVGAYRSFWGRLVAVTVTVIGLLFLLISFELGRERGGRTAPYDYVGCVTNLGKAKEASALLRSISTSGGLGLSQQQIKAYETSLTRIAPGTLPPAPEAKPPTPERANTYLAALGYRAFVTPIQGAAWHQLYVEQYGSPGIGTLPLALKVLGFSTDASVLVYSKYGVIFSGGDATDGSTTPTSFMFAYPAYFGWIGLMAVLMLIIAIDGIAAIAMRGLDRATLSIAAGLLAVIAYNASVSDLWTVMFSHGGGVALLLIIVWGVSARKVQDV